MRSIILFALFALAAADMMFYQSPNDHLDIDALLANRGELLSYLDCFEEKSPCTELTAAYKSMYFELFVYMYNIILKKFVSK